MAWTYAKAQERINRLKNSVPEVNVEHFVEDYLPRHRILAEAAVRDGQRTVPPLAGLTNQQAVMVDGVHVYANLLNFDDFLLEQSRETTASHQRALQFLHLHYSACDRAVEQCGAQRVDFHGQRLHAVVVEPAGDHNRAERVRRAMTLALTMQNLASLANTRLGAQLSGRYRIGIDTGVCVAIKGGRGTEPEPLFIGHAANYAAKLAEGAQPGVFVSDTVEAILHGMSVFPVATNRLIEGRSTYDATAAASTVGRDTSSEVLMESWQAEIRSGRAPSLETFAFHYHQPPLSSIDYARLMPSNSIRMPLLTLFADIDGYTAYIQAAMSSRSGTSNAVRNLHVIRGELSAVLRDDFNGKKVRFIGDCIHGLFAVGDARSTDLPDTISNGTHLVGATRSSFDLCKKNLVGIDNLGLAIGFELGETPVSRIGIRGDRSVRVAVSRATAMAEDKQSQSDGRTTAIGPNALANASGAVRRIFATGAVRDLDYDAAKQNVPLGNTSPAAPAMVGSSGLKAHVVGGNST